MNTSGVLNKAAELIESRGWRTGEGWLHVESPADQTVCLEGAIQGAIGHRFSEPMCIPEDEYQVLVTCPAYQAVTRYLDAEDSLYWWNDDYRRTDSEVIEVLRACAVIEASRERESADVAS